MYKQKDLKHLITHFCWLINMIFHDIAIKETHTPYYKQKVSALKYFMGKYNNVYTPIKLFDFLSMVDVNVTFPFKGTKAILTKEQEAIIKDYLIKTLNAFSKDDIKSISDDSLASDEEKEAIDNFLYYFDLERTVFVDMLSNKGKTKK